MLIDHPDRRVVVSFSADRKSFHTPSPGSAFMIQFVRGHGDHDATFSAFRKYTVPGTPLCSVISKTPNCFSVNALSSAAVNSVG